MCVRVYVYKTEIKSHKYSVITVSNDYKIFYLTCALLYIAVVCVSYIVLLTS